MIRLPRRRPPPPEPPSPIREAAKATDKLTAQMERMAAEIRQKNEIREGKRA